MQVFQPSSVFSVVLGQARRKYGVLHRYWLSVLSLLGMLRHRPSLRVYLENSSPLGAAIAFSHIPTHWCDHSTVVPVAYDQTGVIRTLFFLTPSLERRNNQHLSWTHRFFRNILHKHNP
jgi:hypothetical protein